MLTRREVSSPTPQGYLNRNEKKKKCKAYLSNLWMTQADKDTWSSEWLSLDSRNYLTEEALKESEMFK